MFGMGLMGRYAATESDASARTVGEEGERRVNVDVDEDGAQLDGETLPENDLMEASDESEVVEEADPFPAAHHPSHHAGHQRIGADRATVVDVLQNLQRAPHDVVALLALDVGHEAQTAGIVFVALGVQTVVLEILDLGSSRHGESSYINRGERKITTGHEVMQ